MFLTLPHKRHRNVKYLTLESEDKPSGQFFLQLEPPKKHTYLVLNDDDCPTPTIRNAQQSLLVTNQLKVQVPECNAELDRVRIAKIISDYESKRKVKVIEKQTKDAACQHEDFEIIETKAEAGRVQATDPFHEVNWIVQSNEKLLQSWRSLLLL